MRPQTAAVAIGAAAGALVAKGIDRARAIAASTPATRSASSAAKKLSKADAELAAALAADDATSHLVAGWPAAGQRDAEKAALLAAVRARIAAPGRAATETESNAADADSVAKIERLRQACLVAPSPEKRPKQLENISDASAPPRTDDYYWLRDDARKDKDVLGHLARENEYVAASLADVSGVVEEITRELRAAIKEEDEGAPVRKAGYWWWWRTKEGGEYRQHVRKKVGEGEASRPPTERDAAELVKRNEARAAARAAAAAAAAASSSSSSAAEGTTTTATQGDDNDINEEEEEEIILDEDARSRGHSFYMTSGVSASPDGAALAWGEDVEGGEKYTLHCIDLRTREPLIRRPIAGTAGNFAFSSPPKQEKKGEEEEGKSSPSTSTSTHLFYTTKDDLDRPCKVWRHEIGGAEPDDVLIYHETDEAFYVHVGRSRDGALLLVTSGSAITTEVRALKADEPESELVVLLPRKHDVEYDVGSHAAAGRLVVSRRTPDAPNSELLAPALDFSKPLAAQAPLDLDAAPVLAAHRRDVKLEDFVVSSSFLALFERAECLQRATVFGLAPGPEGTLSRGPLSGGKTVAFDDAAYELGAGVQSDFDSPVLRLSYSSLASPPTTLDLDATTSDSSDPFEKVVVRVAPVLGGFDASDYTVERLWAPATPHDANVKIPISLVYNNKMWDKGRGPAPLLLNGYGAYEVCNDAGFHQSKLPLLDRGATFAIAHVRGGGDQGRLWGEAGKYCSKPNTWRDFIACARFLVAQGYTSPELLACEGRSAGGLLIGATLNEAPELFSAAIAGVPFVDCLTTMCDESIPLTVIEYEEWGCPKEKKYFDVIASYSPYDNVIRGARYPTVFVTAGLHDPRVGYWEPSKWVARLRELGKPRGPILFKCDLGAGHFSKSGRFDRLSEVALEHAFLLKAFGLSRAERKKVKRN